MIRKMTLKKISQGKHAVLRSALECGRSSYRLLASVHQTLNVQDEGKAKR